MVAQSSFCSPCKAPEPETVRMVCKARNMPRDHNSDTAFFDVPINAQHGQILVCSHPACRKSGRQFRYCAVCHLPVIKRNFRMRHSHGMVMDLPDVTVSSSPSTATSLIPANTNTDTNNEALPMKLSDLLLAEDKKRGNEGLSEESRPSRSSPPRSCKRQRRSYSYDEEEGEEERGFGGECSGNVEFSLDLGQQRQPVFQVSSPRAIRELHDPISFSNDHDKKALSTITSGFSMEPLPVKPYHQSADCDSFFHLSNKSLEELADVFVVSEDELSLDFGIVEEV